MISPWNSGPQAARQLPAITVAPTASAACPIPSRDRSHTSLSKFVCSRLARIAGGRQMTVLRAGRIALHMALLAFAATWLGCGSVEKHVVKRMDDLRLDWQTNLQHQANLPEKEID